MKATAVTLGALTLPVPLSLVADPAKPCGEGFLQLDSLAPGGILYPLGTPSPRWQSPVFAPGRYPVKTGRDLPDGPSLAGLTADPVSANAGPKPFACKRTRPSLVPFRFRLLPAVMFKTLSFCVLLGVLACGPGSAAPRNAIVIMAVELGYGDPRAAGPWQGGKYSIHEGGTRTPLITHWRGRIPSGVSEETVCIIDLATSFAVLTGVTPAPDAFPDSFEVMEALLGKPGAKGRDHLIQQDNGQTGNDAFRAGNWKLPRHDSRRTRNRAFEQPLSGTPAPQYQRFDLTKDPGETTDVSASHPDVAERLKNQIA